MIVRQDGYLIYLNPL